MPGRRSGSARLLRFPGAAPPAPPRTDHALLLFQQACTRIVAGMPGAEQEADAALDNAVEVFRQALGGSDYRGAGTEAIRERLAAQLVAAKLQKIAELSGRG